MRYTFQMKQIFSAAVVTLITALPVSAQQDDGSSLMEEGTRQFLEGLLRQMEPALEGMSEFIEEMGPAMAKVLSQIEDWSVYEAPEILENGDIIIRRKQEKDPGTDPAPSPETTPEMPPQVDL
ncbi:hypothetical protein [Roseobacter sp.]|uniref:hypothetical protein n=1 Tax=Roseobacter sp. TaxID=1907202 RepID=UPI0025D8FE00|nr:hypothetical protein [Roseobacter sp.]